MMHFRHGKMRLNQETDIIANLAKRICVAARTAPKGKGDDTLSILILLPKDYDKVLKEMKVLFEETKRPLFDRDSKNLKNSEACILFGIRDKPLGLNCGACGYSCDKLKEMGKLTKENYSGPNCAFKIMDLGIALGSAGRTAMELCVDNRMMYSIGLAAKRAKVMDDDVIIAMPLSIKGKNIYFDRQS